VWIVSASPEVAPSLTRPKQIPVGHLGKQPNSLCPTSVSKPPKFYCSNAARYILGGASSMIRSRCYPEHRPEAVRAYSLWAADSALTQCHDRRIFETAFPMHGAKWLTHNFSLGFFQYLTSPLLGRVEVTVLTRLYHLWVCL
jgi:hypothetical protein